MWDGRGRKLRRVSRSCSILEEARAFGGGEEERGFARVFARGFARDVGGAQKSGSSLCFDLRFIIQPARQGGRAVSRIGLDWSGVDSDKGVLGMIGR